MVNCISKKVPFGESINYDSVLLVLKALQFKVNTV